MSCDEDLAQRMRELLADRVDVTEKKMFGGLAFLVAGHLAVSASGQGGVIVWVDPESSEDLVATTKARPTEMRGRPMRGWLRVDVEDVRTKRQLAQWVHLGTNYAARCRQSSRRLRPRSAARSRTWPEPSSRVTRGWRRLVRRRRNDYPERSPQLPPSLPVRPARP